MSQETRIVHLDQKIAWVGGKPVCKYTTIIDKEAVANLPLAAMGLPYKREQLEIDLGIDEEFEGLSNAEVMSIRLARRAARGNPKATNDMLDRILGKPKTSAEVKSVRVDYKDYIKEMAETINIEEAEYTEESL